MDKNALNRRNLKIVWYCSKGYSDSQVAEIFGLSQSSIVKIRQRSGILRGRKPLTQRERNEVLSLYFQFGKSLTQISDAVGISHSGVKKIVDAYKAG